ncbi:hypothetical protein [Streptomyces sp. NPDC005093]
MSLSRSAEIQDSPVSPTSPSSLPNLPTGPALFLSPPTGEPLLSLPSPSSPTSSPDPSSPQDSSDEAGSWSSGYAGNESSAPHEGSSDTPSTAGDKQNPVTAAGLRRVMEQGVLTVTNMVASVAANETEQEYGLWRADPDDVDGISRPAARLLYRRLPGEARDSDAIDLFGLALALGAYLVKNFRARSTLRELQASAQVVDTGVDIGASDAVPTFPGGGF